MPMSDSAERRREAPDRNLAMELVRVTEAAAMAAGRWVGRGDKNGGDGAAVDAMRQLIGSVSMRGIVVIGEGEKDEAPMLFNGEEVGNGEGPWCDVAVDPIDGTTLMAKGMPGSVAVLAVAERGAMFDPSAVFYMEKLAVGPEAADVIDITVPVAENIRRVAEAKSTDVNDVTVCVLDRPRHADLVKDIRRTGARIHFITDGDLLSGVHYRAGGCTTQSIVMRSKSGTVRMIDGYHRLTKLREYSSVDFDLTDEQLAADPVPPLP